ncbi:phosphatase PAP2 family protein [Kordiimonas lipolytica]|uniref:Phosphatase PAP2 family protein n=1 Tax=Kordiimonas lipolytica TaxID=1662421 RepID=A0ABV8UAX0_9PROT|nr:phosphatase PAP2 family protein [Kordiimonas lipolytica]
MITQPKASLFHTYRWPCVLLLLAALCVVLTFSGFLDGIDKAGVMLFRTDAAGSDPVGPYWAEKAVLGLTHLGDTITLIIFSLLTISWLLLRKQKAAAIYFLVMAGGSFLLSAVLKAIFGRARPDIVEHVVHASSASFPSGHTLRSAAVFLSLLLLARLYSQALRGFGFALAVFVLFMGIGVSRIYLGVHWPSDIIFGWLVAGFWVSLWAPKLSASKV